MSAERQDLQGGFSTVRRPTPKDIAVAERLRLADQKRARKAEKLRKELTHG